MNYMNTIRRRLSETNLGLTGQDEPTQPPPQPGGGGGGPQSSDNGFMVPSSTNAQQSSKMQNTQSKQPQNQPNPNSDQGRGFLGGILSTSSSTNTVRSSVDGEAVRNSSSNMAQGAQNAASNFFSSMANAVKIPSATDGQSRTLLVIENRNTDWAKLFSDKRVHGVSPIKVEQVTFEEISVTANSDGMCQCAVRGTRGEKERRILPEFVLIRQKPITEHDRNILLGFKMAGLPSTNSLHSLYNFLHAPWVLAQLSRIQARVGKEQFPTIPTVMLPNAQSLRRYRDLPATVISGNRHDARLRVRSREQIEDIIPILQQTKEYLLVEPMIKSVYELHIIRLGGIYKVFVRTTAGNELVVERVELNDKYKLWIDAVGELFGGLDIAGVRAIHTQDGKDIIMSIESSWLQLETSSKADDENLIAEVVKQKMDKALRSKGVGPGAAEKR